MQFTGKCAECGAEISSGIGGRLWAKAAVDHYDVCPKVSTRERLEACRARQRDTEKRKRDEVERVERRFNKKLNAMLEEDDRLCAKISAEEAAPAPTQPSPA
jgi:hypothetical protein